MGGNAATAAILEQLYLPETVRDPRPPSSTPGRHGAGFDDHHVSAISHAGIVYAFTAQPPRSVIYTGGTSPAEYAADFTQLAEELR